MNGGGKGRRGLSWAGLAAGPAAWAINTQLNYPLPAWTCVHRTNPLSLVALALALVALAGGWLSWRAFRQPDNSRERHFLAAIGAATALLFTMVILMQGSAALVFTGCER